MEAGRLSCSAGTSAPLIFNATRLWQIVASALVMGLAVCGMHFTDMKAAIMQHDPTLLAQAVGLSPEILAYVIFLAILSLASLLGHDQQAIAIRRMA